MFQTSNIDQNITKFNNADYEYTVVLCNDRFSISLPNGVVKKLIIQDNLYSIFPKGLIIIDNPENGIEGYCNQTSNTRGYLDTSSFRFQGSGKDYVIVRIKPIGNTSQSAFVHSSLRDDAFKIEYIFSISDEDELVNNDERIKYKVFHLVDSREYILSNKSDLISTSEYVKQLYPGINIHTLDNMGRSVPTGFAIKQALTHSLKEYDSDIGLKFSQDWDNGGSQIFFSSPPDCRVIESIEYLLDAHVSSQNYDNCFLRLERNDTFSLRSYSEYFKNVRRGTLPGDFIIDLFHASQTNNAAPINFNTFSPQSRLSQITDSNLKMSYNLQIDTNVFGGLDNFSYVNITGVDGSSELVTHCTHSYDFQAKTFLVEQKYSGIESVKNFLTQNYIKAFGGKSPTAVFPLHPEKKTNQVIRNVFSTYPTAFSRLREGRNKILQRAIDFSTGLSFSCEGFTHRRAGRFITIVHENSIQDSVFQNMINGEWLVTECMHIFEGSTYTNNFVCVKPYSFKNLSSL